MISLRLPSGSARKPSSSASPGDEQACPNAHCEVGSAYIFVRDGTNWVRQAILRANDGLSGDRFGRAVAISRNTAVIGTDKHAAYVLCAAGGSGCSRPSCLGTLPARELDHA